MNPVESALQHLFNLAGSIPPQAQGGAIMLFGGFMLMVYNMSRKNLLGGQERAEMRRWSDMSAALNDRIAKLTPHYAASMELLAQRYAKSLQGNKDVVRSIKSIEPSIKEKAEMDYCMRDANKDETVAILTEQLESLLKRNESV